MTSVRPLASYASGTLRHMQADRFVRIELRTWRTEEERNGPPEPAPESHLFRTGPATPRAQHHHRVDVRGRPPLQLHDARRLRPARPGGGDPAGTRRMAPAYARAPRRRGACGLARGPQCGL